MAHTLREEVDIAAPVEDVWHAVHVDIAGIARWSRSLVRTEVVGGGAVRRGTRLLYVAKLPGGMTQDLHLHVTACTKPRRCAGTLDSAVMKGTWTWTYAVRDGVTHVTYETAVDVKGLLRFAGGVLEGQIRADVQRNLEALKRLVEQRVKRRQR